MANEWMHKVVESMKVPGASGVFVLGSFERRVTLYSQQVRALNLADALISLKKCGRGSHVAVVGAGLAGLTFAAAMARRGVEVTVLEKEDRPLPLLRHAPPRWLHPRVYDWPLPGWNDARAGLPVLDWEAGKVTSVAKQLESAWDTIRTQHRDLVHEVYRVREVKFVPERDGVWLSWNEISPQGQAKPNTDSFSLVVLAVGFGLEKAEIPDHRSYWEQDDLDVDAGFIPGKTPPRKCLVSGAGDGALTDLLRLCIRGFHHEHMIQEFVSDPRITEAIEEILSIEKDPRAHDMDQPAFLHKEYEKLRVSFIVDKIRDRLRSDTQVTLSAATFFYFQRESSCLNRFLVSQLRHAGGFSFVYGKLSAVQEEGRKLRVVFSDGTTQLADRVVARHGPRPAVEEYFPTVWKACEALRESWKQAPTLLDQTRERYWEKGIFGPEGVGSHPEQLQAENHARLATEDRKWVEHLEHDPRHVFADWDPFCQNPQGVFAHVKYVEIEPDLPPELKVARDRLRTYVMDEGTLDQPNAPFNGPRYCLRSFERDVRRFGEKPICTLEFGPSDYRTFLVTNGIDARWAERAGLSATFESTRQWGAKWGANLDSCSFFRNSFGINILVSALGDDGQRYVLFNRRNSRTAVRRGTTGASANEGLRRAYNDTLFDQRSRSDPTPDLEATAFRAVAEELGLSNEYLQGTSPLLLSVGQVRSLFQPAALFYWPLNISVNQLHYSFTKAPDRNLEFDSAHFVRFSRKDIINFIRQSEAVAPVESWVVAMAFYALDVPVGYVPYSDAGTGLGNKSHTRPEERIPEVRIEDAPLRGSHPKNAGHPASPIAKNSAELPRSSGEVMQEHDSAASGGLHRGSRGAGQTAIPEEPSATSDEFKIEFEGAAYSRNDKTILVSARLINSSDRPNGILESVLILNGRHHHAVAPNQGFGLEGRPGFVANGLTLNPGQALRGAWYFGPSFTDGGERIELSETTIATVEVTPVRGPKKTAKLEIAV